MIEPCLRRRSSRALLLYLGFIASMVVYGVYLWVFIPDGTAWMIVLALVFGHLYGFPLLLALLAANLVMGRVLFPQDSDDSGVPM